MFTGCEITWKKIGEYSLKYYNDFIFNHMTMNLIDSNIILFLIF